MSLVVAGATMGSMWGLGGLVLAILGLSGVLPVYMAPAAGIVLGLAFLMLGGVSLAWARMFRFAERGIRRDPIVVSSGVAAVWIAGLVGAVLSILNLVLFAGPRFGAATIIALGLGLLWHSAVVRRVSRFTHDYGTEGQRPRGPFAINAMSLAPVRDFLVGACSVILGILAMLNTAPAVLGLVALLMLGGALCFTASTICGATLTTLHGVCSKG